jgi:hypothetical protein
MGHRERFLLIVRDEDGGDAQFRLDAPDLVAQLSVGGTHYCRQ